MIDFSAGSLLFTVYVVLIKPKLIEYLIKITNNISLHIDIKWINRNAVFAKCINTLPFNFNYLHYVALSRGSPWHSMQFCHEVFSSFNSMLFIGIQFITSWKLSVFEFLLMDEIKCLYQGKDCNFIILLFIVYTLCLKMTIYRSFLNWCFILMPSTFCLSIRKYVNTEKSVTKLLDVS